MSCYFAVDTFANGVAGNRDRGLRRFYSSLGGREAAHREERLKPFHIKSDSLEKLFSKEVFDEFFSLQNEKWYIEIDALFNRFLE